MKIAGEYRIGAPRDQVWTALNDPDVLRKCIPGCESLEKIADDRLEARVRAVIGPVRASFDTTLSLQDLNPPASYTLVGESKAGAAGFGRGSADVTLGEVEQGTLLRYEAEFKVGGKLAQVGSRLVAGATRKTADEFFGRFAEELDPGARRIEADLDVEEEEGIEAAETAMALSRVGTSVAVVLLILLLAWFLLG